MGRIAGNCARPIAYVVAHETQQVVARTDVLLQQQLQVAHHEDAGVVLIMRDVQVSAGNYIVLSPRWLAGSVRMHKFTLYVSAQRRVCKHVM